MLIRMIRSRRFIKFLAIFFLLNLGYEIFFPSLSYALTAGPTTPEATSFEPVDTTDMVNLQTGDFTYNIPMLEVPGPEGGFPVGMSYHAGTSPDEEASWAGLGWTLNPGAINRTVSGAPDDWYNESLSRRDYWSGGVTSTTSVGVNVGIANTPARVGLTFDFANDTYRGFGVGVSGTLGAKYGIFKAQITGSLSPYGDASSAEASLGIYAGESTSAGIGLSTNFHTVGGFASFQSSLIGLNLSTSGKTSLSVLGGNLNVSNDKAGNISTDASSGQIDIPLAYFNLHLGYNYTRYWSDETTTVNTHGSLYLNSFNASDAQNAFDTYSLSDFDPLTGTDNIVDNTNNDYLQGGSFPDFDNYSVTGQGLSGVMRPYLYKGYVAHQNQSGKLKYYGPGTNGGGTLAGKQPAFRFINDFSNRYTQQYADMNIDQIKSSLPFDAAPVYGNNDNTFGFDATQDRLAGSKHIIPLNYTAITPGTTNDLCTKPSNILGFQPNETGLDAQRIAGFAITNESGVTYNYCLPAYTSNEVDYSEQIIAPRPEGNTGSFNRLKRPGKYAYTWMLTTMTGPDFVDRNANGIADAGDWGYWVNFQYGKWTDNYLWRNPGMGFQRDLDNTFRNSSRGKKEIYYLNAIQTRSHTALFVKQIRPDARGGATSNDPGSDAASFEPYGSFNTTSVQSMKLASILLLNNSDVPANLASASTYFANTTPYYGNNVIDVEDIKSANIQSKVLREIDLVQDYSLTPNTVNSFVDQDANKSGKLTLKSLVFKGKGGTNMIPPIDFDYELPVADNPAGSFTISAAPTVTRLATITATTLTLTPGDIMKFGTTTVYYAVVIKSTGTNTYQVKIIGGSVIPIAGSYSFSRTKNPPYDKDSYDLWGSYKSDYTASDNYNASRITNAVSARGADVWNLRNINTSLGADIKIDYEPDVYSQYGVKNRGSLIMRNFVKDVANGRLTADVDNPTGYDLNQLFAVGTADAVFLRGLTNISCSPIASNYGVTVAKDMQLTIYSIDAVNNKITLGNCPAQLFSDASTSPCYTITEPIRGNLFYNYTGGQNIYGGGIRVKSLAVNDGTDERRTVYSYGTTANAAISSGSTPYEPNIMESYDFSGLTTPYVNAVNAYKRRLYEKTNYLLTIARELPPPAVMYEYVGVSTQEKKSDGAVISAPGKILYQFEPFRENMIGRSFITKSQNGNNYAANLVIRNLTASVGNLKRIITYDDKGRKLKEHINNYLHDGLEQEVNVPYAADVKLRLDAFNDQGLIAERHAEVKEVTVSGVTQLRGTMSAREEYPNVQTGSTDIDYVNKTQASQQTLGFDFYSGAVTSSVSTDAYGNRFLTEVKPAYRQYPQMGLKVINLYSKHMLSQVAGTYVYKVNSTNVKQGLVSASVSTWTNLLNVLSPDNNGSTFVQNLQTSNGNIWRKQTDYLWAPSGSSVDGMTAIANFADINWADATTSNAAWKKINEVTLTDVYSHVLESRDINNNYGGSRMGYNNSRVLITGSPAKQKELAFSGAEDAVSASGYFGGMVSPGSGTVQASPVHTGEKSLLVNANAAGFSYNFTVAAEEAGRQYKSCVWVKSTAAGVPVSSIYYTVNGGTPVYATPVAVKKSGDWYQINIITPAAVAVSGNVLAFGCKNTGTVPVNFDDFRVQPLTGNTTAFVYDSQTGQLTYRLNDNNLYLKYEYDDMGRLLRISRETFANAPYNATENAYNYGKALYIAPVVSTIYARMTFENEQSGGGSTNSYNNADVYVRFYQDAAGTTPMVLSQNVPFTYNVTTEDDTPTSNTSSTTTQTGTGAQGTFYTYLGNFQLSSCDYDQTNGNTCHSVSLMFNAGSTYVIIN